MFKKFYGQSKNKFGIQRSTSLSMQRLDEEFDIDVSSSNVDLADEVVKAPTNLEQAETITSTQATRAVQNAPNSLHSVNSSRFPFFYLNLLSNLF
jgi:hypothetical protein